MIKDKKLNPEEVASFCSQLALLLPAGISPYEAISLMQEDVSDPKGKDFLELLHTAQRDGLSFYDALESTHAFPDYVLSMVLLGEASGNLDVIMQKLADYYEQQCAISSSVKNALRYPLVMTMLMTLILFVLLTKILPIFHQVFLQLGKGLTGIAGKLLYLGRLLESISFLLLPSIILILILLLLIYTIPVLRKKGLQLLHHSYLTRDFFLNVAYARLANALSMINASGMDLFYGFEIAKQLVNHNFVAAQIDQCVYALSAGSDLYEAMKQSGIFQKKYLRMLQLGQHAGETDMILAKISAYYEEEALARIQRILNAIEPTLVIFFSLLTGMILLSVIIPLIGIMSSIG